MSKKLSIFDKVASKTNANVLGKVDPIKGYVDIGNLAINYICSGRFYGGGIPIGSVAEFFGPSSSAKSLLGTNFLRGIQKLDGYACVADTENTINKDFVETVSYLDTQRVIWGTPSTLEDSFNFITNVVKEIRKEDAKGVVGVLFDSIAVCPCKREFEETNLPVGYTAADFKKIVKRNEQPGERAKICSKELRNINSVIKDNEATLVIINQIRDKIGVYYGCHTYNTKVMLEDGTFEKIGKIVNNKMDVKVLSLNMKTGKIESKKITGWHDNGNLKDDEKFIKFRFRRHFNRVKGCFISTPGHIVIQKTKDGFKEIKAEDLKVGDSVCVAQSYLLNEDQWQVVYGSILGDGSLRSHDKISEYKFNNNQLRFCHGIKQKDYLELKRKMMEPFFGKVFIKKNRVYADSIPLYEFNSLSCYKKDYYIPQEIADNINELGLAIWYMDDGTYSGYHEKWGNGKCTICCMKFKNREIMLPFFEKLGLNPQIKDVGFVFNSEDTLKLHQIIARFVPESMEYKLHPTLRGLYSYEIPQQKPVEYKLIEEEILSIEDYIPDRTRVKFDLTVEDNSTYFVGGACVHNSPETTAGGGRSLEFYCSIRLRTQRLKNIVDKNFKKKIIGVNIKVQNKKNKVSTPFGESEGIKLFFEAGIDPFSGLFSLLLQEKRVVESGKGSYKVSEEFLPEGKTEFKFKASKSENTLPAEVLFECPKLVDAENTEQLVEYYSSFNNAMKNVGEFEEISTTETNEDEEIESLVEASGETE